MNQYKKFIIPGLLITLLAIGAILFSQNRDNTNSNNTNSESEITSYQECIDAGYPSLESYPAQCKTPDGQTFTEDIGNEQAVSSDIKSENPRPNQTISSPLQIKGEARGNWFFEASFSAHLVDATGKEIAVIPVTAKGEWMTTNFVPYLATMTFATPQTPTGTLVLKNANASGLPENDKELRIPVKFSQYNADAANKTTVKTFFNDSAQGAECENVLAVNREVTSTPAIARAALEELLKGPTQEEKNKGYTSLINVGTKINSLNIVNGTATVDFNSTLEENSGGSCRALAIRAQITQTLKQFPTVKNVVISVDGKTEGILQP
jgi:hypothetical protein